MYFLYKSRMEDLQFFQPTGLFVICFLMIDFSGRKYSVLYKYDH